MKKRVFDFSKEDVTACPKLGAYEKDLLIQVIRGGTYTSIGKKLGKDRTVVSRQARRAMNELQNWKKADEQGKERQSHRARIAKMISSGSSMWEIIEETGDVETTREMFKVWKETHEDQFLVLREWLITEWFASKSSEDPIHEGINKLWDISFIHEGVMYIISESLEDVGLLPAKLDDEDVEDVVIRGVNRLCQEIIELRKKSRGK